MMRATSLLAWVFAAFSLGLVFLAGPAVAQEPKPAPQEPTPQQRIDSRKMVIMDGPIQHVHYNLAGLPPDRAELYRRLEYLENEAFLSGETQQLKLTYARNEERAEALRTAGFRYGYVGPRYGFGLGGYGCSGYGGTAEPSNALDVFAALRATHEELLKAEKAASQPNLPEKSERVNPRGAVQPPPAGPRGEAVAIPLSPKIVPGLSTPATASWVTVMEALAGKEALHQQEQELPRIAEATQQRWLTVQANLAHIVAAATPAVQMPQRTVPTAITGTLPLTTPAPPDQNTIVTLWLSAAAILMLLLWKLNRPVTVL